MQTQRASVHPGGSFAVGFRRFPRCPCAGETIREGRNHWPHFASQRHRMIWVDGLAFSIARMNTKNQIRASQTTLSRVSTRAIRERLKPSY